MELIYYHAIGHGNLPERGFTFSSKWKVEYDVANGAATIIKNPNFISNFFGPKILSLTALIGPNGTGKTTILNTISRTLAHGNNIEAAGKFAFVVIYSVGNKLYLYSFNEFPYNKKNKLLIASSEEKWKMHVRNLSPIFFSQHIEPLYSENAFHRFPEKTFPGRKDISTAYLYRQCVNNNPNDTRNITREFRKQDYRKYLKFFKNVSSIPIKLGIKIPKFITIELTQGPGVYLNKIYDNWPVDDYLSFFQNRIARDDRKIFHFEVLRNSLWQLFGNYSSNARKNPELAVFFDKLKNLSMGNRRRKHLSYLRAFEDLIKITPAKYKHIMLASSKLISWLESKDISGENLSISRVWLPIDQNLNSLLAKLDKAGLFEGTLQFIEIGFAHDPVRPATYSSGEYLIWSLFSRLYDMKREMPKHVLLLLDEVELNLHPQWQKKLVSVLVEFLNNYFGKTKFQVVLSSHSPLILSDIPRSSTVILPEEKLNFSETFGANIHDLYSDEFFLADDLIGEFAREKIQKVIDCLNKKEKDKNKRELKNIIDLIGEPFLREGIENMYYAKYPEDYKKQKEIKILEAKLKKLKNDRNS